MSSLTAGPRTTAAPSFAVVLRAALLGAAAGLVAALVSWLLVQIPIRSAFADDQ